jgi:hypothetical protein
VGAAEGVKVRRRPSVPPRWSRSPPPIQASPAFSRAAAGRDALRAPAGHPPRDGRQQGGSLCETRSSSRPGPSCHQRRCLTGQRAQLFSATSTAGDDSHSMGCQPETAGCWPAPAAAAWQLARLHHRVHVTRAPGGRGNAAALSVDPLSSVRSHCKSPARSAPPAARTAAAGADPGDGPRVARYGPAWLLPSAASRPGAPWRHLQHKQHEQHRAAGAQATVCPAPPAAVRRGPCLRVPARWRRGPPACADAQAVREARCASTAGCAPQAPHGGHTEAATLRGRRAVPGRAFA